MDTSGYESFSFKNSRAINVADGSPERVFPPHRHAYGEIIAVGHGSKNLYKINDTLFSLDQGDILLIWPMELHEITDADRMNSTLIQYSSNFADSLFDFKRIMNLYHGLHVIKKDAHPKLVGKLQSQVKKMSEVFFDNKKNNETRCAMHLMEFMLILDEFHNEIKDDIDSDHGKAIPENTLWNIISVTDYIKNNLTADDLSQTAMAERAGISKDYFSRVFKEVTGVGYSKWLNMVRVEKAISLLPEDGLSLTEIAMLSGFKSIPSFNRVFAEYENTSPSAYRRKMK
jgi:AraC-like DNA-binding protein